MMFITVDETWIHYYTPETSQQSRQWMEVSGQCSKEGKNYSISQKGDDNCFLGFSVSGAYRLSLEKGKTINRKGYATLLEQLNDGIKTKSPHLA